MSDAAAIDEELMERLQRGDRSALGLLFGRHQHGLRALLSRMVRDSALAEDLLQTTFLSVLRSASGYQRARTVVPWLNTIAANAARDSLRRAKLQSQFASVATGAGPTEQPPFSEPSQRRAIERAFALLPAHQRHCVVLHKLEGRSFAQIAASLDITEAAARLRAHRGYQHLRALLHVEHVETSRC